MYYSLCSTLTRRQYKSSNNKPIEFQLETLMKINYNIFQTNQHRTGKYTIAVKKQRQNVWKIVPHVKNAVI